MNRHEILKKIRRPLKKATSAIGVEVKKLRRFSSRDVAYLHIGKNAGTQIRYISSLINSAQKNRRFVNYGHALKLADLPPKTPYFFSIREPASRFKSAFYSRKRAHGGWKKEEHVAFSHFEHANDLAEALFSGGESGNSAFWAMHSLAHVKHDQLDWFKNCGCWLKERAPAFIIRQECLDADFAQLLYKLDIGITWDNICIPQDRQRSHSFEYADAPNLSNLAISNIKEWYRRDYVFYDLCIEWIESNKI